MPVQPFGKADPQYDALRVLSNNALLGAAIGDTIITGGLENKIYLWPSDGSTITTFDPDQAGLIAALAAAASGNTVWLPSIPIAMTAGITVPAGVTVRGIAQSSVLSFSGFSGIGITLNGGSVLSELTVVYNGVGQATAQGVLASGSDWNLHLCNFYIHSATTNIGLQGDGIAPLLRGFIEFSHIHVSGGTTDQAVNITAGGCVTLSYSTFLSDLGATTNQALNNATVLPVNQSIVEHCRFDSDQDAIYNSGYLVVFESIAAGTAQGLNNQAGATAQVFALRWSSLSNAGTLTYLSGDRSAWDTSTYFDRHASDISDATFTYHHNPASGTPLSNALTNTHIFVGNVSNVATDVAMSNDATISNTGALTLKNTGPGATGPIGSGTVTPVITIDAQGRVTALSSASITSGHTIQDEGVSLTTRTNLNFTGTGVEATDDAANNATVVTIDAVFNIYNEIQTGTGGVTYYLANIATANTVRAYVNGIRQPVADDDVNSDVVTFIVAPAAGDTLIFDYEAEVT